MRFVAPTPSNTAPSITVPDTTVEATNAQGAVVNFAAGLSASDLEDGDLTARISCTPVSGSTFALGETTVNCSVTDLRGLSASRSFKVTVVDTNAPVISDMPVNQTLEATGPDGAVATWTAPTANDKVDGSVDVICAPTSGSTFALGITSVTCTAKDSRDNSANQSFDVIVRDTTVPTLTDLGPTAGPDGNNGWYKSAVTNTFRAADLVGFAGGLANPHTFTKSSGTAEGSAVKISSGPVSDAEGNEAEAIDSAAAFKIDLTKPTSSVTDVINGATYTLGSVPAAACSSLDNLSSVVTPATLTTTGGPIGSVTVSCNGAVDGAGNVQTTASSVTYNVVYNFTGFFSPVDMNGVFNVAKAGSAIPVKFKLGGNQGLNIFASGYPKAVTVNCSTSAPSDLVEEFATATTSGLKYDATADQYNYTWKTSSRAGTCVRLDVKLVDGKTYFALFSFK